jgi:hypothetical protein
MGTEQGDVSLLQHPISQKLLQSKSWARLAYTWSDGTPRVVPIGFHWKGREIVMATGPDASKMNVLHNGTKVALTIESDEPTHVLLIRGSIKVDTVDGIAPEFVFLCRRYMGKEVGDGFVGRLRAGLRRMSRIVITPEWVGVLDFETRFHHWLEEAMARAQGAS